MIQPVKTIDFLPDRYRQATHRRRTKVWQAVVAVLFVGVFAAAACGLSAIRNHVRTEFDLVAARHAAASAADLRLKSKESRLGELQTYADLLTFLRHPWPRSRIIRDINAGLPESVTIEKLKIAAEVRAVATTGEAGGDAGAATDKNASTDLAALFKAEENADLIVRLEGTTTDQSSLHGFLRRLVGGGLFTDAEVEQIEAIRTGEVRKSKFTARVVVRPGWGMPGGPTEEGLPPLHTVDVVAASAEVVP
jgi:hypothetical protein